MHGYSQTPLAKKLGIKEKFNVHFVNIPEYYFQLFIDFPETHRIDNPTTESVDFLHLFCSKIDEFEEGVLKVKPFLKKNGMLWVSWPKGSSKIETDLSSDSIRDFLLKNGLVDVKVCAVDADWSGLKFVYRLKDR